MAKINKDFSSRDSSLSKKDVEGKYNSSNPVLVNLEYDDKHQAGGTMIATKFTVDRKLVEGEEREIIQVTFFGKENLRRFTVIYPLEAVKYLAPALAVITEGKAAFSNETNLDW
jgi:hypothetical protein